MMPKPRQAYTLVEEAGFAEFEWHEAKRSRNWNVHQLDFEDVKDIFLRPHVCAPSIRGKEQRWSAVGLLDGVEVTVIFTMRGERCRLISARRARHDERRTYHEAVRHRSTEGKN
ncbi:MAG TPA: BrnT family toxin [Rhizobiales bacterium]|nr:BrnT family toxin [Hyphomicrobiales bacterium]